MLSSTPTSDPNHSLGGNHLAPDSFKPVYPNMLEEELASRQKAMRHTQQIIEIIGGWSTYSLRRVTRGRGCLAHQSKVASLSPRRIIGAHPMRGLFPSQKVP
ncbi:uncharacterized protein ARMOST_14116 [Armillaria ostoyae]|uniref:Uncharacterized protein n=1 Tax=Armillaria ostoyae TaxID=47428 RepID=A0A284RPL1_ARMOS|nr:uncharacterized protein ARMOST_14116 [Armillaria ostoyae]